MARIQLQNALGLRRSLTELLQHAQDARAHVVLVPHEANGGGREPTRQTHLLDFFLELDAQARQEVGVLLLLRLDRFGLLLLLLLRAELDVAPSYGLELLALEGRGRIEPDLVDGVREQEDLHALLSEPLEHRGARYCGMRGTRKEVDRSEEHTS